MIYCMWRLGKIYLSHCHKDRHHCHKDRHHSITSLAKCRISSPWIKLRERDLSKVKQVPLTESKYHHDQHIHPPDHEHYHLEHHHHLTSMFRLPLVGGGPLVCRISGPAFLKIYFLTTNVILYC